MITVACVFVQANVPYGVEYVTNLRAMVKRHLARRHAFVCLTDRPGRMPADVEPIQIDHDPEIFGWWAKLECFNGKNGLTGRVLYLDLDTLVVNDLSGIVDYPADFALIPHSGTFTGIYRGKARQVIPRFNSSVMVWNAGQFDFVWQLWDPTVADWLHGDQDWLGLNLAVEAQTFPSAWCPRLSELHGQPPGPDAKVVLCKVPKNAIAAKQYPWVAEAWRAA